MENLNLLMFVNFRTLVWPKCDFRKMQHGNIILQITMSERSKHFLVSSNKI